MSDKPHELPNEPGVWWRHGVAYFAYIEQVWKDSKWTKQLFASHLYGDGSRASNPVESLPTGNWLKATAVPTADPTFRDELRKLVEKWVLKTAPDTPSLLARAAIRDCAGELSALLTSQPQETAAREWQPIETAPKDGSSILIGWLGADSMYVSRWLKNFAGWSHPPTSKPLNSPTHWMPLPAPPGQHLPPAQLAIAEGKTVETVTLRIAGRVPLIYEDQVDGGWSICERNFFAWHLGGDGRWYRTSERMPARWPTSEAAEAFLVQHADTSRQPMTYEQRQKFACKVCSNVPDQDGILEHGRGCYTQSEDGGGSEYIEEADTSRPETELACGSKLAPKSSKEDAPGGGFKQKRIIDGVRDMLAIIESEESTEQEKDAAASTIVEAVAPDIMEKAYGEEVAEWEALQTKLTEQRRNLGAAHDETLAELERVRKEAATEIERLQSRVQELERQLAAKEEA